MPLPAPAPALGNTRSRRPATQNKRVRKRPEQRRRPEHLYSPPWTYRATAGIHTYSARSNSGWIDTIVEDVCGPEGWSAKFIVSTLSGPRDSTVTRESNARRIEQKMPQFPVNTSSSMRAKLCWIRRPSPIRVDTFSICEFPNTPALSSTVFRASGIIEPSNHRLHRTLETRHDTAVD